MMPNSYPDWWNFQFAPNNHYGFLFLHTLPTTIAFKLEYVLFYQFYAEITTFFNQEMFGSVPIEDVDVETFGGNDVNMTSEHEKWRQNVTDIMHEVVLHPSREITFPSPGWVHGNSGRVCKKRFVNTGENRGNTGSYTTGHFIWNLWNEPSASFINFIWNDHECKILIIIWPF